MDAWIDQDRCGDCVYDDRERKVKLCRRCIEFWAKKNFDPDLQFAAKTAARLAQDGEA